MGPATLIQAEKPETESYIVAIGASAGGLEAIHELFDNMPDDTNFSFVIIQHLSPDYKSLMPELLSKHTSMDIVEAEDGMRLRPNHIYVIPSKKIMTIKNGTLSLKEKTVNNLPNTAIDSFLTSLAAEKGNKAIGIILSGTGTDGTKGIEAIKNNGGIVIVQDPISAKFDGMPNSAISTGYADLILPPELIPNELTEFIVEAPFLKAFNELNRKDEGLLKEILDIIKKQTGYDFSNYKRPTISRRLIKRMTQNSLSSLLDYRNVLLENDEEVKKLSKEFLIGVTKFFRDEEAFECVRQQVIPALLNKKEDNNNIKLWVVACSTGEEAYSLAILLHEHLEKHKREDITIKIFASDIDHAALEFASRGLYPLTIANDVSPDRLENYFKHEGDAYRIIPSIRKMVVFAPHDILKDPPFSKLDFISCRNMLIYMNQELQQKVLKTFHFALNTNAYLMLGPSENINALKDCVVEVNKKWKIFKTTERARLLDSSVLFSGVPKRAPYVSGLVKPKNALNHLAEIFKDTLVEEFNYASILIDKEFEVKQAIGNFKNYLQFPDTNFNFNLLKLVVPDLAVALTTSVRRAIKENQKVTIKHLKVNDQNNISRSLNVLIKPFLQPQEFMQPFILIVLSEEERVEKLKVSDYQGNHAIELVERIQELENELMESKENLQSIVEELETSNEELQSSNEEMISANEELQSTNEELQSLNEELHTVNTEHQLKIKELIELNDDLNNYFLNTDIGQILVDKNLIIRKFTPSAKNQVNLIETDLGRRISDISNNFDSHDFITEIKTVIKTNVPLEKEVKTNGGRICRMRINPFVRQDKSYDGAVISFVDITELKELNSLIEGVFNSSVNGIMALKAIRDEENKIVDLEWMAANHSSELLIGVPVGSITGKQFIKDFPNIDKQLFERYVEVITTGQNLMMEYHQEKEGKWFQVVGVKMNDGVVVTFADITTQKHSLDLLAKGYEDLRITSNQLRSSNSELERSNYDLMQFASVASHDLKEPLRKIQTYGNLLHSKVHQQLKENELSYLDKMVRSAQRMQVLIDDVLTFSKLSNKSSYFTPTNINNVVNRILEDLEITIKEKKVQFNVSAIPEIEAIPGQMHQLFQNLISNALKFNNKPEPFISIEHITVSSKDAAEFKIHSNDFIGICVQDNGIGFDQKYADKIFKIFQRLHHHTEYQGTGIGLAICKKIIENHNGYIKVESEPGNGSKFLIYLPKKQVQITHNVNLEEVIEN